MTAYTAPTRDMQFVIDELAGLAEVAALAAFAQPGRKLPLAEAFATAGSWLYAGFFIGVGAASLRHFTPLVPPLAWGAVLFGMSLLLVPALARSLPDRGPSAGRRVAALLAIILLLAAGYHARMG